MNDQMITKFYDIVEEFPEEYHDIAVDGLIEACDNPNLPEADEEAKAFIYRVIQNDIRDEQRKEKTLKRETKMPQNESVKNFEATIPAKDSRQPKKFKGTFEQFYAKWLGEHNTTDSTRNRVSAEGDWDVLKVAKTQPVVISLEDPLYDGGISGDPDLRTQQDVRASDEKPIDDLLVEQETIFEMRALNNLKRPALRQFVAEFLPKEEDAPIEELKGAYLRALLTIAARVPDWKNDVSRFPICDIHYLAQKAGVKTHWITTLEPAQASSYLNRL